MEEKWLTEDVREEEMMFQGFEPGNITRPKRHRDAEDWSAHEYEYVAERQEALPAESVEINTLIGSPRTQVTTLNVGSHKKLMWDDSAPKPAFVAFLSSRQRQRSVVTLQEVHLLHTDPRWIQFVKNMKLHVPWMKFALLAGPEGTALIYSHDMTDASVKNVDPTQNTVCIQLRGDNVHDAGARICIWGVYFPFGKQKASLKDPTVAHIKECSMMEGNQCLVVGDFNGERWHKKNYSEKLIAARLKRVNTGVTGKPWKKADGESPDDTKGGKAQGIWSTHPEKVVDVTVLVEYDELSNHHRPVVCYIPSSDWGPRIRPLNLHSEMRFVPKDSDIGALMEEAENFEQLMEIIVANTGLKGTVRERNKQRKKKDVEKKQSHAQSQKRMERVRKSMAARVKKQENALFSAALSNGPLLKSTIMEVPTDVSFCSVKDNAEYVAALKSGNWRRKACQPDDFFRDFKPFADLDPKVIAELTAEFEWESLLPSREGLGHTKTFADFEAKVAHRMGPRALAIVAKKFSEWAADTSIIDEIIQKLIGIPTRKTHSETDIQKILQKVRRPIGIQGLFRAWFSGAQALRLRSLIHLVAPANMHGFIPNREGHDMVLQLAILIAMTNPKTMPLWLFQADIVKCFDALQFEIITLLDKLMKLPRPFFEVMARQFEETIHEVRINSARPVRVKQDSGATQGNQRVPALSVLILAPLAAKLEENAKAAGIKDQPMHTRSVVNFADDWVFSSECCQDNVARFVWARSLLRSIGMDLKLVAVACNEFAHKMHNNGYSIEDEDSHRPNALVIEDTEEDGKVIMVEYPIVGSIRILGECIHVKEKSECALTKCKRCSKPHPTKMCAGCKELVLNNVRSLPVKIVDKVECVNQRLLSSFMYGAYSCTKQREALHQMEDDTRRLLFGFGSGGYVVGAHLPAKKYGLGLRDSLRNLAIETAAVIERGMAREKGTLAKQVVQLFQKNKKWPPSISTALHGKNPCELEPLPMIIATPHRSLMEQDVSSQRRVQIEWFSERSGKRSYVRAIARGSDGRDVTHYLHKDGDDIAMTLVKMLAQIIESEWERAGDVYMELPWEGEILKLVESEKNTSLSISKSNRVFISVLARLSTARKSISHVNVEYEFPVTSTEATVIPDAYPLSIKVWGKSVVTGSLKEDVIRELKKRQESEFWDGNRQLKHLVPFKEQVDLELSCVSAGILRGTYYTSELPARRANLLMRLLTGAEIKTEYSKCQIKECKFCDLTLEHIASHVDRSQVPEVINKIDSWKYPWTWLHRNPPNFVFLGLVHGNMTSWQWNRKEEKEFAIYMKKVAAEFAELGLVAYDTCSGRNTEADTTPEIAIQETHTKAAEFTHQAYADYSLCTVNGKDGSKPTYFIGLGGYVCKGNVEIARFQFRRWVPAHLANSTIGEHLANVVLVKMTKYLELDNVCFLADNKAVPEHLKGEFSCNMPTVVIIRAAVDELLRGMKRTHGWIPRLKNKLADMLAGEAAKGEHFEGRFPKEYVKELDELLGAMMGMSE